MNAFEVKNISKKYQHKNGETIAIENVNLKVKKGEFISIIGPSGCGKSTLLSVIAGLEEKSEGEIFIENEKVKDTIKLEKHYVYYLIDLMQTIEKCKQNL